MEFVAVPIRLKVYLLVNIYDNLLARNRFLDHFQLFLLELWKSRPYLLSILYAADFVNLYNEFPWKIWKCLYVWVTLESDANVVIF